MAGDIRKARIKRRTYRFEIKRRFDYVKHYKKLERPPLARIKDLLKSLSAKKKEKKVEKTLAKEPPKLPFNLSLLIGVLIIAFLIVGGVFFFLSQSIVEEGGEGVVAPPPSLSIARSDGIILSSGTRIAPLKTAGAYLYYAFDGNNLTLSLTPIKERASSEVFILEYPRFEATSYPVFLSSLRQALTSAGFSVNDISVEELERLPAGAIVIVPTGTVPGALLGIDSSMNVGDLADRGIVVVYIGQPFTRYLSKDGVILSTPPSVLRSVPFVFDETASLSSENISLFQPLYAVNVRGGDWVSSTQYGSLSVAKKGEGAFVFFPQTLDGGWKKDGALAGRDVARVIIDAPWLEKVAEPKRYVFYNSSEGTLLFTNEFSGEARSVRVEGEVRGLGGSLKKVLYVPLNEGVEGALIFEEGPAVVPTEITGQQARLNILLNSKEVKTLPMDLLIINARGEVVKRYSQGIMSTQAIASFDLPVDLEEGEYVLRLVGSDNVVYAQGYMRVSGIDVVYVGKGEKITQYLFNITMEGRPVSLPKLEVSVDDGKFGTYRFEDVSSVVIDVDRYTAGAELPVGKHVFRFVSGPLSQEVVVERAARRTIFTDPLFLGSIVLSLFIVGLGVLFARREEVYYTIDIPDFPPVSRTKVPLTAQEVLNVFDKVNEMYKWEKTPLSIQEIKNGFRHLLHEGKPIYITDYNVEFLMDELIRRGLVVEELGYYGKAEWVKDYPIEYLALMRRVRDICITHAVPFTSLGESKEADTVLTVMGQPVYVHFYVKERRLDDLVAKALSTLRKGITVILFSSALGKRRFSEVLYGSVSPAFVLLRMEEQAGSVHLKTVEELEKMVKELKVV